jgi:hypothetical protein
MGTLTSIAALHRLRLPTLSGHAGRAGAWVAYGWRRTGAPLFIGVVCIAMAIGLALDSRTTSRDNAVLGAALRASAGAHLPRGANTVDAVTQLDEFLNRLPARSDLPTEVKRLFVLAQQNGLRLETGDYHANPDPTAGILRYAITLPMRGPAGSVQTFVLQALNQTPSLNLRGIEFKRGTLNPSGVPPSPAIPPIPSIPSLPTGTPSPPSIADADVTAPRLTPEIAPTDQLQPPLPTWAMQSAVPAVASAASIVMAGFAASQALPVSTSPRRSIAISRTVSTGDLEARVSFVLLVRLP